ncbi:Mu-like prophage major head subunit gpT family protein [Mesorhizobium sp.]|uniref:phage major capsid protein n=1 Tax=Mesorhizobium sp. TaxID=1871066 RepID=UPI000FE8452B|nr:Mu-like prophage major head subunit gpT family protein [Mesorhizobium sp.]RWN11768.1 MAG: hypothetical protein EOR87_14710 [Mesorhizobium sp.]RWN19445.1 MAG: hypothetical protein EOR88_09855 [Mesorhizobium sp.]
MKRASFSLAAVAMILCAGLIFGVGIDVAHAAPLLSAPDFGHHFNLTDHVMQATLALAGLRTRLAELTTKAEQEKAKIKDDTTPEAARAIEAEHTRILAEIETVNGQIRAAEEEEARNRANPPADPAAQAATRAADILAIGTRAGMESTAIEAAIRANDTVDAFRVRAFDHLAAQSGRARTEPARGGNQDETVTRRNAMTEALSYGLGAPIPQAGPSAAAREFMGRGLINLAAESIGYRGGVMLNARQIDDILTRASHTTSDFPAIFEGAVNRSLEQRYALAQPTYRRIARQRNFRDFRPHTTVKLGDFPMLQKVLEAGEIKYGTFSEGKETVSAFSYAIALTVTRQMLINDDLGAINDLLSSYGQSVALFEEVTFYSTAFNGKLADGKAVFHADHANLAGAASAVNVAAVGLGVAAMAKQESLEGNPLLSNRPTILLTGPDKDLEASMLLAPINAAQLSNVNPYSGKMTPISTAQISGNAWYLFADPASGISNYRWGYLEGYDAPRVRMDEPFGKQGFSMSVEHDFGCGPTDYRGGYKNAGA